MSIPRARARRRSPLRCGLLVLLGWLLAHAAFAQDAPFPPEALRPAEQDVSTQLLKNILGPVVDKVRLAQPIDTGDSPRFGTLFALFNGFLMLVLGLLLLVKKLASLLDTAHEGEVLGEERSTTWTPVRIVLGVVLLLPTVNGFCLVQVLVLLVTLSGTGLCDAVWNKAVDQFSRIALYTQPPPPQARQLAVALLASNLCERIVTDIPARGNAKYVVTQESLPGQVGTVSERSTRWSVTDLGEAACGGYTIREPAEGIDPRQGATGIDALDGFLRWVADLLGFGEDIRRDFSRALLNAHEVAALEMRAELRPLAENLFASKADLNECVSTRAENLPSTRCLSVLDAAAERYVTRLQSLILGVVNVSGERAFTAFTTRAKEEGWFPAGSWFYRLAALSDYMHKMALNVPEPYPIRIWEKLPREDIETYAPLFKRLETVVLEAESDGGLGLTTGDPNNSALDDVSRDFLRATLSWITQSLIGKTHPLFAIAWIGHALIAVVLSALGLLAVGKVIATTAGATRIGQALGGLTDVLTSQSAAAPITLAGMVLGIVVLALLGFALMAALYLPLVPFLIWTLAGLHWVMLVFQALLALPVWAISYLRNGKGLLAGTEPGWLLLLDLLLRPVLMLFGLLGATIISYYLLSVVTATFTVAAINASSGNTTGPVILTGLVVIFVWLTVDLTLRCFSLVHRVPDFVMRLMGGLIDTLQDHHELQHNVAAATRTAVETALRASQVRGKPVAKVKPMEGGKTSD